MDGLSVGKRERHVCLRYWKAGDGLPAGVPQMRTYWCIESSRFVGKIQIRSHLSIDEAKAAGHIGYAVRYSMWGKGFGTKLLQFAADRLQEWGIIPIYIVCRVDNIGSNKVSPRLDLRLLKTDRKWRSRKVMHSLLKCNLPGRPEGALLCIQCA